jgi:hypothetical protein
VLGAKPDSLTRRSQDLPSSEADPRNQFQRQTILKRHNLGPGIAKAVALAPLLLSITYNPVAVGGCVGIESCLPLALNEPSSSQSFEAEQELQEKNAKLSGKTLGTALPSTEVCASPILFCHNLAVFPTV